MSNLLNRSRSNSQKKKKDDPHADCYKKVINPFSHNSFKIKPLKSIKEKTRPPSTLKSQSNKRFVPLIDLEFERQQNERLFELGRKVELEIYKRELSAKKSNQSPQAKVQNVSSNLHRLINN